MFRARRQREGMAVWIALAAIALLVAGALFWFGYEVGKRSLPAESAGEPTGDSPLQSPAPPVNPAPTSLPTLTPVPTATLPPTPVPPTATPVEAIIEAGPNGLNVRGGPGTDYELFEHVAPGTQYRVIGRYDAADGIWWQIDYGGQPAWAFSEVVNPVTSFTPQDVPEVQPAL